jgi:succinoglycan biosynthesis transport protein ExoP
LMEVRELPVSPHRLKLAVYSIILGLGLAIGVPLLLEYLDHTVTNIEQAEVDFDLRALGIVPQMLDGALPSGNRHATIDSKPDRHLLENFRVIRTNLLSNGSPAGATPQVIMVASSLPQEGKSLVSANLALSFAQMGEKTLIIDADLRRGRLHRAFRVKAKPGLSNVLMGTATLEAALQPTKQENLSLLPYGKHTEGITELLGSPNLTNTLAELRTQFQRIILDTPPVLGLSDAAMLLPVTDGVVFVIWSKRTSSRSLQMALQHLRDNGANIYGFVLNRMDLNDSANYYHYYYYSSYYYQNYQIAETVS